MAVGAQDATRGHRPCRVTADGPAQGGFPSARVCPRVPGRQVRSESKILTGREGNQTENSAFSLHIYNIQVLTHYSKSGFSPWALRDGENSLGINAFSRILKSVRTGQVMLRPSGTNLSGYCARSRDWRERERARTRASEQPGSQRRRRGRWGEGAGERGGQPCPRGLVLRVLRGSLPEGVRKVPPPSPPREEKATLLRRREAGRPSGKAESSGLCPRAKTLPSKHGLCASWSCRRAPRGRPVQPQESPGPRLGSTRALTTLRRQV